MNMHDDGAGLDGLPPGFIAELDRVWTSARANRADGPQAAAEVRCAAPPLGCGQPLSGGPSGHFRDRPSRQEYEITHLCQLCQDIMFRFQPEDLLDMADDEPNYDRCSICGEWRALEHVDYGIGVMSGHSCCSEMRFGKKPKPPMCTRVEGCRFRADHQYNCDSPPYISNPAEQVNQLRDWLIMQGYEVGESDYPVEGESHE